MAHDMLLEILEAQNPLFGLPHFGYEYVNERGPKVYL